MLKSIQVRQQPLFLLWTMLSSKFRRADEMVSPLPERVGIYSLVEEINSGELKKPHRIGVYKNQLGQKSVVKWWTGKSKTFAYYSLVHEISMIALFEKLQKRMIGKSPVELSHIQTPRLISAKTTNENVMMMTEFSEGELLRQTDEVQQIKQYKLSLRFLKTLSENLIGNEKESLPKRRVNDYLFLYPALLGVAILRQPGFALTFLKGVPNVISAFIKIRKQPLVLVHRDLHTNNILVSPGKTMILDLQRVVLTYPLYELVTTLAVEWDNNEFRDFLLESVDPKSLNIFQGLLIYFATHALTANNLPDNYLARYKKMLKFSVYDFSTYYLKKYEV